ncbi:glutamine synthetase [Sinirhodobacter populi]|uniref:Glutamine synthetase n=1 Tax=Paenirhodobacter populi TaxID=2306993 RepID=A0A443K696_9RHOB|nr:glutamine synthetase family protein [Sinirhodobacter populi]RWR28301.1 glutamine synthetase [Sinirhodobacter populi]
MIRTPLIFAGTADVCGKFKGKAFPLDQMERRAVSGIGWTPTNVQITCFDAIAPSPFGALGDLVMVPDPAAVADVDYEDGLPPERLALADIRTSEGTAWNCCPRAILRAALARLKEVSGLVLRGAFEHEFQLIGAPARPGLAYAAEGFRAQAAFCGTLMAALGQAGMAPDTMMKEYGANQFEVTIDPEDGLRIADTAVLLREIVRATALRFGERATFTPILDPSGVGNGVHIHMSLIDAGGKPAGWAADGPGGMSPVMASFVAGILRHAGAIVALTAPSAISYDRLTPHRWSAAFNNLGLRDREAAVRICPGTGPAGFNVEYRAADAAASPYLALAAIVHAGAQGIADGLPAPGITEEDLTLATPEALAARGIAPLPQSLDAALARFEADALVRSWFPAGFPEVYLAHKRGEIGALAGKSAGDRFAAYAEVY